MFTKFNTIEDFLQLSMLIYLGKTIFKAR